MNRWLTPAGETAEVPPTRRRLSVLMLLAGCRHRRSSPRRRPHSNREAARRADVQIGRRVLATLSSPGMLPEPSFLSARTPGTSEYATNHAKQHHRSPGHPRTDERAAIEIKANDTGQPRLPGGAHHKGLVRCRNQRASRRPAPTASRSSSRVSRGTHRDACLQREKRSSARVPLCAALSRETRAQLARRG